jgi:excisionase family DNA binding protein
VSNTAEGWRQASDGQWYARGTQSPSVDTTASGQESGFQRSRNPARSSAAAKTDPGSATEPTVGPVDDLTFQEAAEHHGVTRRTIRRWYDAGKLPSAHLDDAGVWRVARSEVEAVRRPAKPDAKADQPPAEVAASKQAAEAIRAELVDSLQRAAVAEARLVEMNIVLAEKDATITAQADTIQTLKAMVQTLLATPGPTARVIDADASPPPNAPKTARSRESVLQRLWAWLLGAERNE